LGHIENYAKCDLLGKTRQAFGHFHRESLGPLVADTSYTPAPESRDCLKPVSCYRIRTNFSNTNKRFRPEGVIDDAFSMRPSLAQDFLKTRQMWLRLTSSFVQSMIYT